MMMMGEAKKETAAAHSDEDCWTATITTLQPKRLDSLEEEKYLKNLQTTTYVPNGFVYVCTRSHDKSVVSEVRK